MQRLVRSKRFQTITRRGTMLGMVAVLIACSVGVITLNNIVIRRSAELGRLDTERRQLRTENALISADIARLSAPPRITRLARQELQMQPSDNMAHFIYLDPANQPPPRQRRRRRAEPATRAGVTTPTAPQTATPSTVAEAQ